MNNNIKKSILILLFAISVFTLPSHATEDLSQWNLKKQINVYNPFFYNPTNVTVNFTENTALLITNIKMKNDCSDIRIVNENHEVIPYYVQGCNNADTKIWFKIDRLSASQGNSMPFWMYYKNPAALDKMNSNNTFLWADTENFEVGPNKKWIMRNAVGPAAGGPTNKLAKYGKQSMQVTTNGGSSTVEIANLSVAMDLNTHENVTVMLYFQRDSGGNVFQMVDFTNSAGNDGLGFGIKNDLSTTTYAIQTFNVGYQDTGIKYIDTDVCQGIFCPPHSPSFILLEANINSSGIFIILNDTKKFNYYKPQTGPGATQKFSSLGILVYALGNQNKTIYVDEIIVKKYFNGTFPKIEILQEEELVVEPPVEQLPCNCTNLTQKVEELKQRIGELENRVNDAENRLGVAESQLIDSENKISDLESKLNDSENKISDLESKLNDSENKVNDLESRLGDAESKITDFDNELRATNNKLDILENKLNNTTNSFESLKLRVDAVFGYLKNLLLPIKKEMVCGYMKDNKLTKHEALGLKCSISRNNCICSIA